MRKEASTAGDGPRVTRRALLGFTAAAVAVVATPVLVARPALAAPARERTLHLFHRVTGETLREVYFADGRYLPEAQARIDHILRDWHRDEVMPIDSGLLDYLHALGGLVEGKGPVEVHSGYRTPQTNAALKRRGRRPAKASLHMEARALDLHLPGVPLAKLRKAALSLGRGGVGYYPRSGFIHIDTGDVRAWVGR